MDDSTVKVPCRDPILIDFRLLVSFQDEIPALPQCEVKVCSGVTPLNDASVDV